MEKNITIETIPLEVTKSGNNRIDVEVYYSKGGLSYFSGGVRPRGYYVSVTPVMSRNGTVRMTAFSGVAKFLLPTSRYTEKQFETAVKLAKEAAPELVRQVLEKEQAE
jgi:hypothetical protein